MKKAFISLKNGFTCLLDCDLMVRDEEKGVLNIWGERSLSGTFLLEEVSFAYATEQRKKEVQDGRGPMDKTLY